MILEILKLGVGIMASSKQYLEFILGQLSELDEILYLIFNYPHKHNTFKHFEV